MKTIHVDRDIFDFLVSRAQAGESPGLVLRRELHVPQPTESVEVDDATYDYIVSRTAELGESASDILRRELRIGGAPPPAPSSTIVFTIPAGTGSQPWNTQATELVAAVGNVLQIVNDDAVPHRLHTTGQPFPHPATDIMPGQSDSFVLQTAYDPRLRGPLHDHAAGTTAEFWITVLPAA